ncbi:MAG TPA: type II toxin-antitoxin system YafQ family toxin [Ignavibacteriaceae bacterium]|jgi:mRNA interferase YafQ|nr:type II toxin-antitoxin system YafQ family toxin [Ignavibacteriaceae bacterium]
MLEIKFSSQFRKDYKKAVKQNKDIEHLKVVIDKLSKKEKLDKRYFDHQLSGKLHGYRDCHIEPDWLLIYKSSNTELLLVRLGSHSELFKG